MMVTFEDAMASLRRGHSIRCTWWGAGQRLLRSGHGVVLVSGSGESFRVDRDLFEVGNRFMDGLFDACWEVGPQEVYAGKNG